MTLKRLGMEKKREREEKKRDKERKKMLQKCAKMFNVSTHEMNAVAGGNKMGRGTEKKNHLGLGALSAAWRRVKHAIAAL